MVVPKCWPACSLRAGSAARHFIGSFPSTSRFANAPISSRPNVSPTGQPDRFVTCQIQSGRIRTSVTPPRAGVHFCWSTSGAEHDAALYQFFGGIAKPHSRVAGILAEGC